MGSQFRGRDVASSFGYARPNNAIRNPIPKQLKQSHASLMKLSYYKGVGKTPTPNHKRHNHCIYTYIYIYISEAGMYKLLFRSNNKTMNRLFFMLGLFRGAPRNQEIFSVHHKTTCLKYTTTDKRRYNWLCTIIDNN